MAIELASSSPRALLLLLQIEEQLERIGGAHAATIVGLVGVHAKDLHDRLRRDALLQGREIEARVDAGDGRLLIVAAVGVDPRQRWQHRLLAGHELAGGIAVDRDLVVVALAEDAQTCRLEAIGLGRGRHQREMNLVSGGEGTVRQAVPGGFRHGACGPGLGAGAHQSLHEGVALANLDDLDLLLLELVVGVVRSVGGAFLQDGRIDRQRLGLRSGGPLLWRVDIEALGPLGLEARPDGGGRILGCLNDLRNLLRIQLLSVLSRQDAAEQLHDADGHVSLLIRGAVLLGRLGDGGRARIEAVGIERRDLDVLLRCGAGQPRHDARVGLVLDVFAPGAALAERFVNDMPCRRRAGGQLQLVRLRRRPLEAGWCLVGGRRGDGGALPLLEDRRYQAVAAVLRIARADDDRGNGHSPDRRRENRADQPPEAPGAPRLPELRPEQLAPPLPLPSARQMIQAGAQRTRRNPPHAPDRRMSMPLSDQASSPRHDVPLRTLPLRRQPDSTCIIRLCRIFVENRANADERVATGSSPTIPARPSSAAARGRRRMGLAWTSHHSQRQGETFLKKAVDTRVGSGVEASLSGRDGDRRPMAAWLTKKMRGRAGSSRQALSSRRDRRGGWSFVKLSVVGCSLTLWFEERETQTAESWRAW